MASDLRQSTRKVLKVPAMLVFEGERPIKVRTLNICSSGLGIVAPTPLVSGRTGHIHFIVYLNGRRLELSAQIKVVYCVFSEHELKAGLQFGSMGKTVAEALANLMNA